LSDLLLLLLCDEMSSNMALGGVAAFLETVFAKSVWGLTLHEEQNKRQQLEL
jgi:hypothetical protein